MPNTPKNLSDLPIDRQNILNNQIAIQELVEQVDLKGVVFDGQIWFTTNQVAKYFEVDLRTVQRYLEKNEEEILYNGYKVFTGKDLEIAKKTILYDTDVAKNTPSLGMFNFRAFLNLGMLLNDSQKAKDLRSMILDIVINVMNNRLGINRKFINQNDPKFSSIKAKYVLRYHLQLREALKHFVDMKNQKYPYFIDKIYHFLFRERSREYKLLLELEEREKSIDTHYPEIITTLSTFETHFAHEIEKKAKKQERKLTQIEVDALFDEIIGMKLWEPLFENARDIIASRDYGFRELYHPKLEQHIKPVISFEYQTYFTDVSLQNPLTGEENKKIKELHQQDLFYQIEEDKDIYKRMKDK